jgi:hypothetical protein
MGVDPFYLNHKPQYRRKRGGGHRAKDGFLMGLQVDMAKSLNSTNKNREKFYRLIGFGPSLGLRDDGKSTSSLMIFSVVTVIIIITNVKN